MVALSKSALWQKMQDYYSKIGPEAWQDEIVPLQISSNKNLANDYADVIVSHILDLQINNFDQPFYILEIGAGHGKFSFYLIKILKHLVKNFNLPDNCFKYIITDISEKNIKSWNEHPAFSQWLKQGILDFANFNAVEQNSIHLQHSNVTISANNPIEQPIFIVCNYLFDSLAHDAFQIKENKLFETQIKIFSDADWENYFEQAKFKYHYREVSSDYYSDPKLNKILEFYTKKFEEASFLIPIGGIQAINTVKTFTNKHILLLLADKGEADLNLLEGLAEPDISVHGSVSLIVNFDAMARYFNNNDGIALLMPNKSSEFQVACFSSTNQYQLLHTKHAFNRSFAGLSPQDIISLCYLEEEVNPHFSSLDELLSILNLSLWDPNVFFDLHEMLLEQIEEADNEITLEQESALLSGIKQAWEYFFKLEKSQDLPFAIASISYALDQFEQAIDFYKLSIAEFGENSDNLYNLALSYQMVAKDDFAKNYATRTLKLDPEYKLAKELLDELIC